MSETNKKTPVKTKPEAGREESVIKYGFIALAVILGVAILAYLIISLLPTNILMIGDRKVKEEEFNFFYLQEKNFLLQYKDSVAPNVSDEDFLAAAYTETMTFHELAKHRAIARLQEVYIMLDWAKNDPDFRYDPNELTDSKNTFRTRFEEYAFSLDLKTDDVAKQLYGANFSVVLQNHENSWIAQKYEDYLYGIIELEITEDEIISYYNSYKESYDQVTVRHILVTTFDPVTGEAYGEEALEAAAKKAQDLFDRVDAGEDMAALAAEFSEDPGVTENQGIYTFSKGDAYLEEFVEWSFTAEVDDVGLIQTDAGFHVMHLMNKSTFEEVRENVLETLTNGKVMQRVDRMKETESYQVKFYNSFTKF